MTNNPAPTTSGEGHYKPHDYDRPLQLDEAQDVADDLSSWRKMFTVPSSIFVRMYFIISTALFSPLLALVLVRVAGRLQWDLRRSYYNESGEVVSSVIDAAEVARFEREVATILRQTSRVLWLQSMVVAAACLWFLTDASPSLWVGWVGVWGLVVIVQHFRFDPAADKLVADIRSLNQEFHVANPTGFPFSGHYVAAVKG